MARGRPSSTITVRLENNTPVDILNAEAASSSQPQEPQKRGPRRPRKDGRASVDDRRSVGASKLAAQPLNVFVTTQPRTSGRLQQRAKKRSLPSSTAINHQKLYDVPDENGSSGDAPSTTRPKKIHKPRKHTAKHASPLKDLGVIDVQNPKGDLDDSIAPHPRLLSNANNPSVSGDDVTARLSQPRPTKTIQTNDGTHGENLELVIARQSSRVEQDANTLEHDRTVYPCGSPDVQGAIDRDATESEKPLYEAQQPDDVHNLKGTINEDAPAKTLTAETLESSEGHESSASEIASDEAREAQERQRKVGAALRGIEKAVEWHSCKEAWIAMLVAAGENLNPGAQSDRGKMACKAITKVDTAYRELLKATQIDHEARLAVVRASLITLRNECEKLSPGPKPKPKEDARVIRDMYTGIIPRLVRILKRALQSCWDGAEFDVSIHSDMVSLMKTVLDVIDRAKEWKSGLSSLESGVRQRTRNDIRPKLFFIYERYRKHMNYLEQGMHEKLTIDVLERQQRKFDVEVRQNYQERLAAAVAQTRAETRPVCALPHVNDNNKPSSGDEIYDANGMQFEQDGGLPALDPVNYGCSGSTNGLHYNRQGAERDGTDGSSRQTGTTWTVKETAALVTALQEFRHDDRFACILNEYGGRGQILGKFNADQLIEQALHVKSIVGTQLKGVDWLRNVRRKVRH